MNQPNHSTDGAPTQEAPRYTLAELTGLDSETLFGLGLLSTHIAVIDALYFEQEAQNPRVAELDRRANAGSARRAWERAGKRTAADLVAALGYDPREVRK